jgi:alpha-methylacyl-CoA racemase
MPLEYTVRAADTRDGHPPRSPGALAGVRVLELGGLGPVPFAATMLADMGADVVRLLPPDLAPPHSVLFRGRRILRVDLTDAASREAVRGLARRSSVVLEGFRPGVAERLGLGPADLGVGDGPLIYGRVSGWGRGVAASGAPGHDINYLAMSGTLALMRRAPDAPVVSPGFVGDFGGAGMTLAVGVLAALHAVHATGAGQVVDCSIVAGAGYLTGAVWELVRQPHYALSMAAGEAPFYNVYRCADGRFVAVGAAEPKFYQAFCAYVGLDEAGWSDQLAAEDWPGRRAELEHRFASRTRDQWCSDPRAAAACISPVLELTEVAAHPVNESDEILVTTSHGVEPNVGPRLSGTPGAVPSQARPATLGEVLADWADRPATPRPEARAADTAGSR